LPFKFQLEALQLGAMKGAAAAAACNCMSSEKTAAVLASMEDKAGLYKLVMQFSHGLKVSGSKPST
jgi:hypothetical protein